MTSMRDQLTPYTDAGRPPYVAALVVALGALILYIVTLAPTTQFWDASEYITAVHAFGIPHPPGNPLFILLAHAWGLLPLGADYARRINLLAAATSAAAAGFWFLIAERWLRPIVSPTWPRRLSAAAGVMVSATTFTVWNQSVVNEKVYTVSVLSIALVLWLAVRWADQPAAARRDHQLVLIVYLLALTATNHLMGVLAAPALLVGRRQWRAERRAALAMNTLVITLTVALVFYLTFRWGFSQPYNAPGLEHEVRERDYFFIASFALWGIWVGMGLAALMEWLQSGLSAREPNAARRWAVCTPVLLVALVPLLGNRLTASRAGETMARDYARDVLQSLDPYALVVTAGDNDTLPLWYGHEVEGVRRDVNVLVLSLANTDWYLRQLQRRPPPIFDPRSAPALYGNRNWPRPTTPWMSRYYLREPADTLPPYAPLAQPITGYLGPIEVTVDPRALGRPYLERSDLAVLQIIKDQLGKRPIYFSTSTGNYADQLGLSPYLLGEGLVRRVVPRTVTPSDTVRLVPGRGFVNIPRTRALAFDVYSGGETAARPRPRGWVDVPSQSNLFGYAFVYDTIAAVLREREPALALRAGELRDAILAHTTYTLPAERRAAGN